MDLGLLEMDRLPTLEELKEFFRKNDWTTATIDDPAQRTPEQVAEIEYAKKLMDEKFEPLAREKGRKSAGKYYNKEDNPLMALQESTEDLVGSIVSKIANDDELLDGVFSQFDFTDPDIDQKADNLLYNAVNTMLDVMEYDKSAEVIHKESDERDFNTHIENNYRYKDHLRKWNHTKVKGVKVELAPDPDFKANWGWDTSGTDEKVISKVFVEGFFKALDETDVYIVKALMDGYTQTEIANALGFANNGAVSKRFAIIKDKFMYAVKNGKYKK